MTRLYQDHLGGRLDAQLLVAGTTLSSPALAAMQAVGAGDEMVVVLDPDGLAGAPDVVTVTAHTASATTATITPSARQHEVGVVWVHGLMASDADSFAALAGQSLGMFDVTTFGALGDGSTDDTAAIQDTIDAAAAAGGGVVYFPRGVYIVAGALQDTGNANAQLVLPSIDAPDSEQIIIELRGEFAPPTGLSVVGATPLPDNHSIIKGTLNSGTGALFGGRVSTGSFENFTFVNVRIRSLTVRLPANPTLTALDMSRVTAFDADDLVVDAGSYYVNGLSEMTTSTSYGIRCPANNNGAFTRLGAVNVVGFYNGYEFAEHANGQQVAAWGCRRAFVFASAANHPSKFERLMAVHCQRGIVVTGLHYFIVDEFAIEHADSGTWVAVYDIDDASGYGCGTLAWTIVLANTGPDDNLLVNGGSALEIGRVGVPKSMRLNAQTGTTFTPANADTGRLVTLNNGSAITVTLPQYSAAKIPIGGSITFVQTGTGQVTFTAGTGATVNSTPTAKTRAQYSAVTAIKIAASTWLLVGDLAAT